MGLRPPLAPQGTLSPVIPLAYGMKVNVRAYGPGQSPLYFYNRFLNLSLISRFPIYAHFGAKWGRRIAGEIEAPGARDCPVTQGTLSPVIPLAYGL